MIDSTMVLTIRVLVFREGDWWIAQCLEHDICIQARTVEDIRPELERVLTAHYLLTESSKTPFHGMPRAPQVFWDRYEDAKQMDTYKIFLGPEPHLEEAPTLVPT